MIVKRIAYDTFDGDHITENFYFHLSKPEALSLSVSKDEGFQNYLRRISDAHNGKEIMAAVKNIILLAYGEKTPDGKSLIKSQEIRDRFEGSPAFDALFTELVTDDMKMSEFVKSLVPKDLDSFIDKINAKAESEAANGPDLKVIEGSATIVE